MYQGVVQSTGQRQESSRISRKHFMVAKPGYCVVGSVEIGENSKCLNGFCFYIALGGEDQDGIFFPGLVSHLAGWNFI
jgi:hypothetical protein